MNCKRIQDLILTDYIDGELDASYKQTVEDHLKVCPACREFYELAGRMVVEPFLKTEAQLPSSAVWNNIENTLRDRQMEKGPAVSVWERLREWFPYSQPVMALSMTLFLVVMVGALTRYVMHPNINSKEQAAYMAQLADPNGDYASSEEGFGSSVEEYFL